MPLNEQELDHITGRPWRGQIPPFCPACGYNLTGVDSNRCPECGAGIIRSRLPEHARQLGVEIRRVGDANDLVKVGLKFAAAGALAMALAIIRGRATPSLGEVARLVALLCGVPALFLGLNVFRVKRLPHWAQQFMPSPPDYFLGIATAAFGLILIVASVAVP